jgi:hypothetical protein
MAAALIPIAVEQSEIGTPGFLENRTPAKLARSHLAGKRRSSSQRDHRFQMASFLLPSFPRQNKATRHAQNA